MVIKRLESRWESYTLKKSDNLIARYKIHNPKAGRRKAAIKMILRIGGRTMLH